MPATDANSDVLQEIRNAQAAHTPIWWGIIFVAVLYIVASHAYQLIALAVVATMFARHDMVPNSIRVAINRVSAWLINKVVSSLFN